MHNYDPKTEWAKNFLNKTSISFPSEYVIRIFKGNYPNLNLTKNNFHRKKICDIGCGDGRNIVLLHQCDFDIFGTEISEELVNNTKTNLNKLGISAGIKVGTNDYLPFDKNYFDYLLSWNSCYYMGKNTSFQTHVNEFARILKPDGYLILSIPKKTNFIFSKSVTINDGYQIIKNDPFNIRNGEILRMFENEKEIQESFSDFFTKFIFGSIEDDCFGFNYHWHLLVCQKKSG